MRAGERPPPALGRRPNPTQELQLSREMQPNRQLPPEREPQLSLRPQPRPSRPPSPRRASRSTAPIVLLAAAVLVSAVIVGFLATRNNDPTTEAPTLGLTDDGTTESTAAETQQGADDDLSTSAPTTPAAEGPFLVATLNGPDFFLDGVVPSASLAGHLLETAEIAYSPFVRSTLTVDEQLGTAEWLDRSAQAITLLPMITSGSIRIADGQVTVSGQAPTTDQVDRLRTALGAVTGLPVEIGDMEITGLAEPDLFLTAQNGRVRITGHLPTVEIRQGIVAGAVAAYGESNVTDETLVDGGVFPALWMYSGGQLMQAMSVFPDYEIRILGTAFSGYINGGVTFETGSAEFSGDYARVLDVGVAVLTRDPSLQLSIEGHTDSQGPDEVNLELSRQRAEAVMQYFIERGIAPDRLTAVGKGETEPVESNDTPEGQARNRRIEYILTSRQ